MGKGKNNEELFRSMPVTQAILTLAVPTVVSQIITIIYNMADTFFIGQLGDPKQVAAATLAMPLFMFMTALSNLFGVGGAQPHFPVSGSRGAGKGIALRRILYLDSRSGFCFVWPDGSGWKTSTFTGSRSQ